MKVCIIGGVAGGATAAARLRRLDEKAQIIVFERGDYISFANCGLPYHISGRIKERKSLLLQTPERLWTNFRIEVRVRNEVLTIDPRGKLIRTRNLTTGDEYTESYDYLVLSPGAYPLIPPIEGSGAAMFMSLYDIPGMDAAPVSATRLSAASAEMGVMDQIGFLLNYLRDNRDAGADPVREQLADVLGRLDLGIRG